MLIYFFNLNILNFDLKNTIFSNFGRLSCSKFLNLGLKKLIRSMDHRFRFKSTLGVDSGLNFDFCIF